MPDEQEMGSAQQKQKRGFPGNDYYFTSVSMQFAKGLWNIPFAGFKLPTTEVKNTKSNTVPHLNTAGQSTNTRLALTAAHGNNRASLAKFDI